MKSQHPNAKAIRVLIVEDSEDDFYFLKYLLERSTLSRYEVEWAPSYDTGVEAVLRCQCDVALFDYRLGRRTGLDLLREAVTANCEMPMILLTGHESMEVDQEALAGGAADYLCKVGLNTTGLERSIRYALRHAMMLSVVRKSQSQLELFMRNVPCAVCIRDENGDFLFQNEKFRTQFDYQALGQAWDHSPGITPWPFVDRYRHWLVSSFPMVDTAGRRLEGLAAIDITERVRAEEMLQRTRFLLNGLVNSLPVMAGTVEEDGTILEWFGQGLAELGMRTSDWVGTNINHQYPEVAAHIRRAIDGADVNFLWEIARNGRVYYFDNYFRFHESRGSGAIGFAIDVTERVEAEAARNRQTQILRAILRTLPVTAGRIDLKGTVVEVMGDGLSSRGMSPGRLLGHNFGELYPQSRSALLTALQGGTASFSLSGRGQEEWQADFVVFFDAENAGGAVFFGHDMTDRRMLERKLLEVSDAERQRIGADLHDGLGQHLTGIACMVTALRDRLAKAGSDEARPAAVIAQLVNEAISQTRALARGLCPVQLERADLPDALEDLALQVQMMYDVQCRLEADSPAPTCTPETAIHLYRVAQEAINNAIRHGHAGKIVVELRAGEGFHSLSIQDDGVGFNFRPHHCPSSNGLRLMQYRASMIGGIFNLQSQPGKGTRILCTFPNEGLHENSK